MESASPRTRQTVVRRMRSRASVALSLAAAGLGVHGIHPQSASARTGDALPTVGMQDRWIDACDRGGGLTNGSAPAPAYTAAPTAMADGSLWSRLRIRTARITVPWDIAYHHDRTGRVAQSNALLATLQSCVNYWLTSAAAHHVVPEVQFRPDYNHLNPQGTAIMMPSLREYRAAMRAFMRTYVCRSRSGRLRSTCPLPSPESGAAYPAGTPTRMATVRIIAPWGEPDFGSTTGAGVLKLPQSFRMPRGNRTFGEPGCSGSASTCGPTLAAQMWVTVHNDCRPCIDIAGTFSSDGGLEPFSATSVRRTYLGEYQHALGSQRPGVWALDPYSDVSGWEWRCWYGKPPYGSVARDEHHARDCARVTGQQQASQTITARFGRALGELGYTSATSIWLGEVSIFYRDMYNPKTIAGTKVHPTYGWNVEKQAARYLLHTLARPGGVTAPGEPEVRRLYYMQFSQAQGFPNWALVLTGPNGAERPVPAYSVFARRDRGLS